MVKVLKIAGRPAKFSGEIRLPPSKSYLHRALFTSALTQSRSSMIGCGTNPNNDIRATINCIKKLGPQIEISSRNNGTIVVTPGTLTKKATITVNAQASGTTARFLIPFSALTPDGLQVRIEGDASLRRRPMEVIFDSLTQLGVRSKALNSDGRLPIVVEGGGIEGGDCEVNGSISSQFVSSLLIACTRARKDSTLHIKNPETMVSKPYILATLAVLSWFGFRAEALESSDHEFTAFKIAGQQKVRGKKGFPVPGDMSSGASLVCAVLAARGEISLSNADDEHFPQSDSAVIPLARKFGGVLTKKGDRLSVSADGEVSPERFDLDLGDSPDLVPPVVGVSAAIGSRVKIIHIG
ncbi:MAG: hypothetical protein OK457_04055, partial [Thaumarchaeota archaeon]|nr:hypothetical protein [Nitrososphaerota archaeon]